MRGRPAQDDIDVAAAEWARAYVREFKQAPTRSGQMIGPLSCTLGRVRELHDAAASNTEHSRHWPETLTGEALRINLAVKQLTLSQRTIFEAHYLIRMYRQDTWERLQYPLKQYLVAGRLGLSLPDYYHRRDRMKDRLRALLTQA